MTPRTRAVRFRPAVPLALVCFGLTACGIAPGDVTAIPTIVERTATSPATVPPRTPGARTSPSVDGATVSPQPSTRAPVPSTPTRTAPAATPTTTATTTRPPATPSVAPSTASSAASPDPSPDPGPGPYTLGTGTGHSFTAVTAVAVDDANGGPSWEWVVVGAAVKQTRDEVPQPLRIDLVAERSDPALDGPALSNAHCIGTIVAPDDRSVRANGTVTVALLHGDVVVTSTAVDVSEDLAPGRTVTLVDLAHPGFGPELDRQVTCVIRLAARS